MEQDEFVKLRVRWEKTGDLRYVWRIIATCLRGEASMPPWVENYLIDVAAGIEAGKKFPQKKPGAPRQIYSLINEKFGIAFICEILKGNTSGKAREKAAEAAGLIPEGKELPQRLKDFFDLDVLPDGQQQWQWKLIVTTHLLNNPAYLEDYPVLSKLLPVKFPGGIWGDPPG